jgi:coenzyme F420-reducing hydrogenase delta subunit/Pyruvate/2-oxoacid:ferredoxin oxidoreductase delta subunit
MDSSEEQECGQQLKEVEIPVSTSVLVVGSGHVACFAARELAHSGHEVLWCSSEGAIMQPRADQCHDRIFIDTGSWATEIEGNERIKIIAPAEVVEFRGFPGRFRLTVKDARDLICTREIGAVILATEPALHTHFEAWGVSGSERVRSLSWLESRMDSPEHDPGLLQDSENRGLRVVFICGFTHHSNPCTQKRAVEAALKLSSQRDNQILFLTEQFKVAHPGMERLSRKTREAGVLFVKPSGMGPRLAMIGRQVELTYEDESLGRAVTLSPDLVVLEESYRPGPEIAVLSEKLGIETDRQGFFQGENIYNQPVQTNREGILAVGNARGPVCLEQALEETRAAVLIVHRLLGKGKRQVVENRIWLDTKKCTICLTCYRLCPHNAISPMNRRPVFDDLACKLCGICAAECPMDAIQIHGFTDQQISSQIKDAEGLKDPERDSPPPAIMAFCCRNSALEAAELAVFRDLHIPEGLVLIRVPCAGRVDAHDLIGAFRAGADGVMVLGCHPESCKSVRGNDLACWRVETIKEALAEAGLEQERLSYGSLAPGMSTEFVRLAQDMEARLLLLGKSPLRRYA